MPDTARTADTTCGYPGCYRSVWQDPDGSFSSYCGKTHRDAMKTRVGADQLCKNCNARPVYVENDKRHDFCGRRCANAFIRTGRSNATDVAAAPRGGHALPVKCKLQGCTRPVYVNQRRGEASEYCSFGHRYDAVETGQVEGCLRCRELPRITINGHSSDFCSAGCRDAAYSEAPAIFPFSEADTDYKEVSAQFQDGWKHPTPVPSIVEIWKICSRKDLRDQFERYKLKIERKTELEGGNTRRRWHGTVRACSIGNNPSENNLCSSTECSLCHIIKSSFKLAKFGQRTNFGRFGEGIYTSATSSKANDYVGNMFPSLTKAMLLSYVVMGNAIKMTTNQPDLTEPPTGYDSVVGEPGGDLNYDESIVYDNDAIRPLFLVVYQ